MYKLLNYTIFFCLVGIIACDKNKATPEDPNTKIETQLVDEIQSNEVVLQNMFLRTANKITPQILRTTKNNAGSREEFIDAMNALTENIFSEEVARRQTAGDLVEFTLPTETALMGDAEITLKGNLASAEASKADPLDLFAKSILTHVQADDSHTNWTMILDLIQNPDTESEQVPEELTTLSSEQLEKLLVEFKDLICSSLTEIPEEQMEAMKKDFWARNNIPPVAAALLLPAVQSPRSSNASAAEDPYLDLLNNIGLCCEINGGLNRDIIRRFDAGGMLGSLYMLTSNNYQNANEDVASMLLFYARYRISCMIIWSTFWDQ